MEWCQLMDRCQSCCGVLVSVHGSCAWRAALAIPEQPSGTASVAALFSWLWSCRDAHVLNTGALCCPRLRLYYHASGSCRDAHVLIHWSSVLSQVRKLRRCITLEELKAHADGALAGMPLLTRGRLSVQPVTAEQWAFILGLEDAEPE